MKILSLLLAMLLFLSSCSKKEKKADPTPTGTTYQTLGSIDSDGKPNYLATPDVLSANLTAFVQTTFPEFINFGIANPALLATTTTADLVISQKSTVSLTFVLEGTSSTDAIAFYTYPTGNPPASATDIKTFTYIFPNIGQTTTLTPGDKVVIGTFNAGTSIGFVLLKNGWNINLRQLNNGALHFYTDDSFNPEADPTLKKHAVLVSYPAENKSLIGFEDENRTETVCDNDFNDAVLYATVTAN